MQHRTQVGSSQVSARASARKAPHPATVAAHRSQEGKPCATAAKPPHAATLLGTGDKSRKGSASGLAKGKVVNSTVDHHEIAQRLRELGVSGNSRELSRMLDQLGGDDIRTIAEHFAGATNWHKSGQVQWLRKEEVTNDSRRVMQVRTMRMARELRTCFEVFQLPLDAVLAPNDWQAMGRHLKARVMELRVSVRS